MSEAGRYIGIRNDMKATDEVLSDGGRSFLSRIVGTSLTRWHDDSIIDDATI